MLAPALNPSLTTWSASVCDGCGKALLGALFWALLRAGHWAWHWRAAVLISAIVDHQPRRDILRVAVLTMLEPAAPGITVPRAFLRIGGISIARQQLGLALAVKCERVICLAHGLGPELRELQGLAEAGGAQFNVIANARQLMGLITTIDEVFVLGDGLFVSTPEAANLLELGQAVLVQPIDQGLAAGFERIDLNHASAALMRIPGRLVERISELPADCDATSALQRIALQAGVVQRPIPALSPALFWTLVRSEAEAHALEPQWIRQRTRSDVAFSPARGLALLLVRGLGPALLDAGSGAGVISIAALIMAVIALGTGWFGYAVTALVCCAIGWSMREAATLLARIEGDVVPPPRGLDGRMLYGWLLDAIMVTLVAWNAAQLPALSALQRFFPAVMLVGLLRLLPRVLSGRWTTVLYDRSVLALLLGGAMMASPATAFEAIHLVAMLLLVAGLVLPRGEIVLTRP